MNRENRQKETEKRIQQMVPDPGTVPSRKEATGPLGHQVLGLILGSWPPVQTFSQVYTPARCSDQHGL